MLEEIYNEIQKKIYMLIPEKWESIHLYAGITSQIKNAQTWELYFYYLPKGVLKRKLINVYEIPSKFNLDETEYLEAVKDLCKIIKNMKNEYSEDDWNSLTISITEKQFKIDFNYENFFKLGYSNDEHHLIWKYKYLNIPIEQFSKTERKIINKYLKTSNTNTKTYIEKTLEQGLYNQIEYSINENLKSINQDSNNSNSLPINQNIDQKVELKNQMLNFD